MPDSTPMPGFAPIEISGMALGQVMPMALWLDRRGTICGLGPTLARILGPEPVIGTPFDQHFRLGRARARVQDEGRLAQGRRLHLWLRASPGISLRGSAVDLGARGEGGVLVNLTFGIHLAEAVREFGLTEADFSPCDLAIELLYLQEAKTAVLSELRALNMRLEDARRSALDQALTDPLTGLANRRAFNLALEKRVLGLEGRAVPFALAHVDLDHFKAVNDTMGHAAGDFMLEHVARVLRDEVRRGDLVARVGGDEFIILLREADSPERLLAMGRRMISRLEEPCFFAGEACRISASIGIALSQDYPGLEVEQMLADADAALYDSKRDGRGRCTIARPSSGAVAEPEVPGPVPDAGSARGAGPVTDTSAA